MVTLILAGTETVAGYPRPSSASWAFFSSAFMAYLPLAVVAAWLFSVLLPKRGLDLWFPLFVGALRMAGVVGGTVAAGEWWVFLSVIIALVVVLLILC